MDEALSRGHGGNRFGVLAEEVAQNDLHDADEVGVAQADMIKTDLESDTVRFNVDNIDEDNSGRQIAHSQANSQVQRKPDMRGGLVSDGNTSQDSTHMPVVESLQIACTSLLMQFSNVKVRADLINGRFGRHINPEILPLLDKIKCLLLPRWQAGGFRENRVRSCQAAEHFKKLISRDGDVFETSDKCSLTYAEWMDTLESVANDRYWSQTPAADRCTHVLDQHQITMDHEADTPTKVKIKPSVSKPRKSNTLSTMKTKSPEVKSPEVKSLKKLKCKVEEVVLSDSSTETVTDSSESSSNSNSDSSCESVSSRKHRRSRRKRSDTRSVVTPPVYKMDGKQSLEDYLYTFERYFKKKFKGNAYDQTQTLSSFLTGELLKVYEIRGGRRMKYSKMKSELLQYYKQQKIGSKTYWRKKLNATTKADDETYDLYGMRLIEIGNLAYPKDQKECAAQLRQIFFKNVPRHIINKVQDAERANNALSSSRKHLPFTSIMKIASEIETSAVIPKTVMWTSSNVEPCGSNVDQSPPQNTNRSRDFSRKKSYETNTRRAEEVKRCTYCKRVGHERRECWRAANLCLICGGNHFIEQCPKYDPSRRSPSRRRNEDEPLNDRVSLKRGNQ